MLNPGNIAVTQAAERLLLQYGFDLDGLSSRELFEQWLTSYSPRWIRLAIIEALYQGRYKAISVEQLLLQWQRRGESQTRFNSEFEAMICRNLPRDLTLIDGETDSSQGAPPTPATAKQNFSRISPDNSLPLLPRDINQFQPQPSSEMTSQFAQKLTAIAQAWKSNQNPLASATLTPSLTLAGTVPVSATPLSSASPSASEQPQPGLEPPAQDTES